MSLDKRAHAFKSQNIAEALVEVGKREMAGVSGDRMPTGREVRVVKTPEAGIPASTINSGEVELESALCEIKHTGVGLATPVTSGTNHFPSGNPAKLKVWNITDSAISGDSFILAVRHGSAWVAVPEGEGSEAPKRVKFKLASSLLTSGVLQSGYANAYVVDPMNSGLAYNAPIVVYDYYKQFVTATTDSIGIAHYDQVGTDPKRWHIEECEQLVSLVKAELSDSIGPWMTGPFTAEISEALSSWPYSVWDQSEDIGLTVTFNNEARITAGDGFCTLRRRIPATYLPDPTNTTCPYTLEPLTPEWDIVSAEKPTARWCKTSTGASGAAANLFTLDASATEGNYGEGFSPALHSDIADGDPADPPKDMWASMSLFKCHIKASTIGIGWLDDNTGEYVTVGTASGLFGLPEKVDMVAKRNPTASDVLIQDKDGECGVIQHEHLTNALVWGNPESGGCVMENIEPLPEVDVFASADDVEVVTGLAIDSNGDLELVKSTIKACTSPTDNIVLPLSQVDIITDVSCDADGLTKSYKTVKYLGSEIESGGPVPLPCTNPDNFDWEYIFNNHVYNETWWNVDYYDITFPEGCEPCPEPTGCCTATAYPNGQDGITQAACEAETGYQSWVEGECSGGGGCSGSDCCCGDIQDVIISVNCPPNPSGPSGGGTASSYVFTQTGNATGDGSCNWTIDGVWNIDGVTSSGSVSATHSGGGCFSVSGTVDGQSLSGDSCAGVATIGSCTGQLQLTHDNEDACFNE